MTEPMQTNPSPIAVPWTPDMMNPHAAPAPQPAYQQPNPLQPQAAPIQQAQPQARPPVQNIAATPQIPHGYAPQPQSQPAQFMPPPSQPAQMTPAPAPQMMQPQFAQAQTPQSRAPQPQYARSHQTQISQQMPQAGPPPLAQHLRVPAPVAEPMVQTKTKSKSLFAKLLKRSPKPVNAQPESTVPAAGSESLFNKNFALGALTGLVIGAFVLPMAIDMFSGSAPVQAQAQAGPPSGFDNAPTASEGETFIDAAIAADAP